MKTFSALLICAVLFVASSGLSSFSPRGLVVSSDGKILVIDTFRNRILVFGREPK